MLESVCYIRFVRSRYWTIMILAVHFPPLHEIGTRSCSIDNYKNKKYTLSKKNDGPSLGPHFSEAGRNLEHPDPPELPGASACGQTIWFECLTEHPDGFQSRVPRRLRSYPPSFRSITNGAPAPANPLLIRLRVGFVKIKPFPASASSWSPCFDPPRRLSLSCPSPSLYFGVFRC